MQMAPRARVLAADRDPEAVRIAALFEAEAGGRVVPLHSRLSALRAAIDGSGVRELDGILMDLGCSVRRRRRRRRRRCG